LFGIQFIHNNYRYINNTFLTNTFAPIGGSKFRVDNITISPLPIKLSETEKVTVSAKVEILEDLPLDALVNLQLIKVVQIGTTRIDIPIPCVDDLGSCTFKICDIFTKWYNDVVCPFMQKAKVKCQCPVTKGVFEADDIKVEVPFAKIKGMIAQLASVIN
jgi:hypothetical protein